MDEKGTNPYGLERIEVRSQKSEVEVRSQKGKEKNEQLIPMNRDILLGESSTKSVET